MTKKLNVKVFSDGAVLETMLKDLQTGLVTGFTTNPSLMKKAGISSYIGFAKEVLAKITNYPVSLKSLRMISQAWKRKLRKLPV